MNFFKLLLIFALLLFGSFGQRFLRYSNNDNALFDGKDSDVNLLSSDGSNAQQVHGDVRLTGYAEEIELELDELKFEYCSQRIRQNKQRCMGQTVFVCYDAENPPVALQEFLQDGCGPNKCKFEAGISPGGGNNLLWFMISGYATPFDYDKDICATATMMSPDAEVSFQTSFGSCKPLITNGKIKLFVKKATPECFLTVKNAKIWTPTTTRLPPTPSPATLASAEGSKEETSNATLIWAIVGGILFILFIAVIALAVWYFCIRKQNKSDKKKINAAAFHETPINTAEADFVQEKKEPVKPKEETVEKKKAIEEEKKPKAAKKEKKVVQRIQLQPSKEVTQENVPKEVRPKKVPPKKVKAPIEPTLDDPTTGASITATENQQPHVPVPKGVIHPAPLQPASKAITQYSRSSSRKGSLSGRHEIGMQVMVEKPSETIIRRSQGLIDDATKNKLERFYSGESARPLEKREIMLFCCTKISVMFKIIELLIDNAIEGLAEHGAKFGDNETVVELSAEGERYVQTSSTPEYVRSFAFGGVFRELIDSEAEVNETCPIPLLFVIVLQRRYSVLNRRQACTWIRRQMPIIFAEFSLKERKNLSYPITAIEDAYKMDPDGFKNIAGLDTESGMEEEPTQASITRTFEKNRKKQSGGGKKKRSKKRR